MGIHGLLQVKNRSGIIETPIWQTPSDLDGNFILRCIMDLNELEDEANGIDLKIYASSDNFIWRHAYGIYWIGGNAFAMDHETLLTGIGVKINGAKIAGKYIKASLGITKPMKVGFELETHLNGYSA